MFCHFVCALLCCFQLWERQKTRGRREKQQMFSRYISFVLDFDFDSDESFARFHCFTLVLFICFVNGFYISPLVSCIYTFSIVLHLGSWYKHFFFSLLLLLQHLHLTPHFQSCFIHFVYVHDFSFSHFSFFFLFVFCSVSIYFHSRKWKLFGRQKHVHQNQTKNEFSLLSVNECKYKTNVYESLSFHLKWYFVLSMHSTLCWL